MAIVGNLVVGLQARTEDFERSLQRARREVTQTQQAVQQSQASFTNLGASITGLAAGVVSFAAVKGAIEGVVSTGLKMEQLRNSFTAIAGSAHLGAQEFAFVTTTANKLGLDLESLSGQYRTLATATKGTQLAGQETRDLFVGLSTAARTYGLSTEQTGRALSAFAQIIAKGKVSQEELRQQLAEALPNSTQIAARAFGVTTQELEKLVEKGLDATEFVRKFTAQLSKETPIATQIAGLGFTTLGNEILQFKDRLAQSGVLKFFDDLATKAAKILAAVRVAGEETAAAAQRAATRALGGVTPPAPGESPDADALRDVEKKIAQQRAVVRGLEVARDKAAFGGFTSLVATPGAVTRAKEELNDLLALEQELAKTVNKQRADAAAAQERSKSFTEIGPQFDAQEKARLAQSAVEKAAEDAATKARFAEIDVSIANKIKAQEEAAQKAKQIETEANQELERGARQRVQLLTEIQTRQQGYLASLAEQVAKETLSEEAYARRLLDAQGLEPVDRKIAESLLVQLDAAKGVKVAYEEIKRMAEERAQEEEEIAKQFERIQHRVAREAHAEEERRDREMRRTTKEFADFFSSTILSATEIGKSGFRSFADSVIADLQRILTRQYLAPQLEKLVVKGLELAASLFGPSPGPGVSEASAAGLAGEGALFSATPRQGGGPVLPRRYYEVGESGRELLYTGNTSGYVYPHGTGPGGQQPITVNNHFHGVTDAGSFQRNRGAINHFMMQAIRNAQRDV